MEYGHFLLAWLANPILRTDIAQVALVQTSSVHVAPSQATRLDLLTGSFQMKPGVFREEYIAIIVRELLKGLEYLHSEGKLHRDIKGPSSPSFPALG